VIASWRRMAEGHIHDAALPGVERDPMLRQQANSYLEGLPVQLFHDAAQYEWAHALERHAAVVAEEFSAVLRAGDLEERANNPWTGLADIRDATTVAYGPEWRTLGLQDRGVWDEVNTRIFPKTTALLHESGVPCVEAFFAKMPAGSKIQPHSDGCNFHLTCHLGVVVPEGECALKVGDEEREWRNGKVMLFDTSVMHSARNDAAVDRYVLMMRVWHPDLKPVEIDALNWIFKCLDSPEILTAGVEQTDRETHNTVVPTTGMSRAERRKAERKAAKAAKKRRA